MEGFQNNTTTTARMPPIADNLNWDSSVIPFLRKTYEMVDNPSTNSVISWGPSNNSLVIWNKPEFERDVLPGKFKHNNFTSFVRQLNHYGFRKVDPDGWEYAHERFLRGQKHLLMTISNSKRKCVNVLQEQPQGQSSAAGACVEVGKVGLEDEIERLKQEKYDLMRELVRLRQKQQSTDHQLQTLGQRLQGMENRQQQMISFLAKAMQSPGFLAQLVQQQNDYSRRIVGVSKKRRLPTHVDNASDGQIIKYQPLLNEAAQAMLMQLNLASPSHRLNVGPNVDSILIDDIPAPSSTQLDSGNRISGVTLSEVAPTSGHSLLPASSGYLGMRPSAAISEIQSSGVETDRLTTTTSPWPGMSKLAALEEELMQDMGLENEGIEIPSYSGMRPSAAISEIQPSGAETDTLTTTTSPWPDTSTLDALEEEFAGYPDMQDMGLENQGIEIPGADFVCHGTGNGEVFNDLLGADYTISPLESGQFSTDLDVEDMLVDGYTNKLPGINDSFWEQFLPVSHLSLGTAENNDAHQQQHQNGWNNMDQFTQQMGLLTPEIDVAV
ncbi:hypothetical protein MKW94_012677 [Papaver nudicaule]|uniref:HSF-type DNA-binding domain-containing protein n=1 Tax=Papaver nudicaule TaxID=74823 RepID=A0AA41VTL9_PAPNU|nr:hypothetical protein [Papaver nudicaule]